ncbi:4956_t:CDS:2, partial [Paraglomus occultum]
TNSEGNLKQDSGHDNTSAPDISVNDSNSDEHQEETSSRVSNSSSTELSICRKPKSLEDKEMDNFLAERHNKRISNEIRERNREKKPQHESPTESSPKENTYMSNNGVSAKAHIKSNISPEQEKEQGLIQEISISINQKQATETSANNSPKMFAKNHVSKNLIQESSGKEFDNQVKNLTKSDHIGEKKAKGQIYDFIIAQLNTKRKKLQKQTQKARKVYNLFEKIGIDKIQHIKTFSADAISRFTNLQIQTVIDHFAKMPDIEFTDDQDNSSDDLPEAEVSDTKANDNKPQSLITALSDDEPENFSDDDEFTNDNEEDGSFCGFSDDDDEDDLPSSACKFKIRDMEALRVNFLGASSKNDVIPNVQVVNFPDEYVLPDINGELLVNPNLNVVNINGLTDEVRTFVVKLHEVALNGLQVIGTDETFTDTLVDDLLRIAKLNNFPLRIRNHPLCKLYIEDEPYVSSDPEFVVKMQKISVLVVEDKHLKNVGYATDFGESQIAVEILSCGSENIRSLGEARPRDQTIWAIRVISTYVTFYKATITATYWMELANGLPKEESVKVQRWPAENGLTTGFDLAKPGGRRSVLIALAKILNMTLLPHGSTPKSERQKEASSTVDSE